MYVRRFKLFIEITQVNTAKNLILQFISFELWKLSVEKVKLKKNIPSQLKLNSFQ